MTTWVYRQSEEEGLFDVGYYDPKGKWFTDIDHVIRALAAERVHYINGNLFPPDETVGPAIMEKAGPGEPTKGHDSSKVGSQSLPDDEEAGNRTDSLLFFIDIITTALEGGIGYWSLAYGYNCDLGTVKIRETEDNGIPHGQYHEITPSLLKEKWHFIKHSPVVKRMDLDDLDADDCDAIIQLFLFNEVIYG